jgi:N-acetylmuramoyl-L-alanine amidase
MGAKMPAVLVEVGYITNRAESSLISSPSYQKTLAKGIADGVTAYKRKIERYAAGPASGPASAARE